MARRFIVEENDIKYIDKNNIQIKGNEVKHIQVLRHNIGENITVNDNIYKIMDIKRDSILLEFIEKAPKIGEPSIDVTLYIAMLKNDKLDFVIQKAVELGVKKIVPFFSSNVIVKLDEKGKQKRKERLSKIADEACKQCGRTDYVLVENFETFNSLCKKIEEVDNKVLFAYEASKDSLRQEIKSMKENKCKNIGIIIGAEGGFTPDEADKLKSIKNVSSVSLGSRILRAETAALNLLSILMYEMEE